MTLSLRLFIAIVPLALILSCQMADRSSGNKPTTETTIGSLGYAFNPQKVVASARAAAQVNFMDIEGQIQQGAFLGQMPNGMAYLLFKTTSGTNLGQYLHYASPGLTDFASWLGNAAAGIEPLLLMYELEGNSDIDFQTTAPIYGAIVLIAGTYDPGIPWPHIAEVMLPAQSEPAPMLLAAPTYQEGALTFSARYAGQP